MGHAGVEALFRKVMAQPPAKRLQLAGLLLEQDPGKAEMALSIAKRAVEEIEVPLVMARLNKRSDEDEKPHKGGR